MFSSGFKSLANLKAWIRMARQRILKQLLGPAFCKKESLIFRTLKSTVYTLNLFPEALEP